MDTQTLIRTLIGAFNDHDGRAFAACYAPDANVIDPQYPEPLVGTEAIVADVEAWFASFPDIVGRVERSVAAGRDVAIAYRMEGTHGGPLAMPDGELAATGASIELAVATIGRVDGEGRIVEERRYYDLAGVMAQLGSTP